MVWLNDQCDNSVPLPGSFGGSRCTCSKCQKARANGGFKVEPYPDVTQRGMSVHDMSKGIKVTHIVTGNIVICQHHRSQHKNKETALIVLEMMLDT